MLNAKELLIQAVNWNEDDNQVKKVYFERMNIETAKRSVVGYEIDEVVPYVLPPDEDDKSGREAWLADNEFVWTYFYVRTHDRLYWGNLCAGQYGYLEDPLERKLYENADTYFNEIIEENDLCPDTYESFVLDDNKVELYVGCVPEDVVDFDVISDRDLFESWITPISYQMIRRCRPLTQHLENTLMVEWQGYGGLDEDFRQGVKDRLDLYFMIDTETEEEVVDAGQLELAFV